MRTPFLCSLLAAATLTLAACATPPNPALEKARNDYAALESQPQAAQLAALETRDAATWLAKADKAYKDGESQATVDQLAYLTEQRIQTAMQTIKLRLAEAQLKKVDGQRDETRLNNRTQQLQQLQKTLK